MKQIQQTDVEQIDSGAASETDVSVDSLSIENADSLHSTLDHMADSFDVRSFKCTECGIAHMHDTTKHRASDSFDMTAAESVEMLDMNPNCHCGYNESAHRGIADVSPDEAASIAPIPDETARSIEQSI